MPIQLTTAFDPGELDVNDYAYAKIEQFIMYPSAKRIEVMTRLGYIDNGVLVYGIPLEGKTVKKFVIEGEDYDTMVAEESVASGEVYYDEVSRLLYQWLLDEGHFSGTIV